MMEDRSLFLFTVRSIVMFVIWSMCQLPRSWNIHVDVDLLLKSITMERCGERVDAGTWPEAPTMAQYHQTAGEEAPRSADPDLTPTHLRSERSGSVCRVAIHERWAEHTVAMARYMPHAYTTAKAPQCVESCNGTSDDEDLDSGTVNFFFWLFNTNLHDFVSRRRTYTCC